MLVKFIVLKYNMQYTLYFKSHWGEAIMITYSGIEAFLAVCRWKSITQAAEKLFICQSSLSVRLKNLENELGTELFLRKKGRHEVILTQSGKDFYEIALAYEKVMARIEKMRRNHQKKLSISSLNSLGTYIMPESYGLFLERFPEIKLAIQDYEIEEACKSILQGKTDLAFNTDNRVPDKIIALPVFSEAFSLICSKESHYPQTVSADMLHVKNEVYVDWYNGFDEYHSVVFGSNAPQIRLDMMTQLKFFVEKPNNWALVPVSVAQGLEQTAAICRLHTDFTLPERTVYCLHSKEKKLELHCTLFLKCLMEILGQSDAITCLLDI